jgi:polysaccharide biosynthesis transport protein
MAASTEDYTMKDYINALRRRAGLIAGVLGLVMGIAIAYALLPPDTYRSTAEMRIDMQGPDVDLLEPIELTTYADQYIKSLQQKVMTNENLSAWIEEANAYWYLDEDVSQGDKIALMREGVQVRMVFTTVIEEQTGKEVDLITGFTTSFTARDPEVARIVAGNAAAAFLEEDRKTRVAQASVATGFLEEQIGAQREEIADIEARIAKFKEEHAGSMPDLLVLNMTGLDRTTQELEQVERELRTLQQDRFFRQAQLQEIEATAGGSASQLAALEAEYLRAVALYGPDHPDVKRLKAQISGLTGTGAAGGVSTVAQLEAELAALQERYSDAHPDVVEVKRKLEAARTSGLNRSSLSDPLYLQLRAQINSIDSQIEGLRARAEELRANRADLQDRIAGMPQVEREFQVLQRELQTATLAFDNLRERSAQARQIQSYESGERGARLEQIRAASAPNEPTGPPRLAIAILGLFIGTTFAGGAGLFAEMSDTTIRGRKDVLTVMHTHAIAVVPVVQNSVYRSERRRRLMVVSLSALMLGAIIFLVIGAVT